MRSTGSRPACPQGSALISATNGKTTTAAMVARILEPSAQLAHNRAGANLVSGVASALVAARDAELGLFEVDEAALPEVARRVSPRAVSLGNLFRDQLDRYGELELVAQRWREMVARPSREARRWSPTATTPSSAKSPPSGRGRSSSAWTTRVTPRPSCSTRPTRSGACAAARRTSTRPRTSATSATTAARAAAMRGRRSTSSPARSS